MGGKATALVLLGCFLRLGRFQRRGSITFALVAKASPAGKRVCGRAAEMRLVQWLPCEATEEQPWLWLCSHTSTVLPSATELTSFVAVGSASVTWRHLGCSLPLDVR